MIPRNTYYAVAVLPLLLALLGSLDRALAAEPSLDPHLEGLRPVLEKTWKGSFKNSTPERPMVDTMRFERALNGKGVRILHSVNDGVYGGETIIFWDAQKQAVTYHYFTTAGFRTIGTIVFGDRKWTTHERVSGNVGSVTEVRGTAELLSDGTLRITTEHLVKEGWQPGREVVYRQDPQARVVFK